MIFNVWRRLTEQFPAIHFVPEGDVSDPQNRVQMQLTTGQIQGYPLRRRDDQIQFRVYNLDQYLCRFQAEMIFRFLRERHGVTWPPAEAEGSEGVPIRIARIAALQSPTPFGRQDDGTFLYVFNVVVTWAG